MTALLQEWRAWQRRRDLPPARRMGALAAMMRSRTIFIHIPKCAGKAVIETLYGLQTHDWFGHADIRFYRALMGPRRFGQFRKFAVLRDPVDRARSAYHFARQGGFGLDNDQTLQKLLEGSDFDGFVASGQLEDLMGRFVIFAPQRRFITDADGRVATDLVCRQEHLEADLRHAFPELMQTATMSQANRSDYAREAEIAPQTRARLCEIYAADVTLLEGEG